MTTIRILAPVDGWCTSLSEVPDAVFSGLMLGDGVAIDPIAGLVSAPCAGEVTTVATGGHAVGVRSAEGLDVLLHVGIDTVQLGGRHFEMLVRPGQHVAVGEPLMRFDLDALARVARSLMTPIVVGPPELVAIGSRRAMGAVRTGELLFEVSLRSASTAAAPGASGSETALRKLTVPLQHGLHARPAALIAQQLSRSSAAVLIECRGRQANARSVVAIMSLEVRAGEEILIRATGTGAAAAIDAVVAGVAAAVRAEAAAGHALAEPTAKAATPPVTPPAMLDGRSAHCLTGVVAVPGFVVGVAARLERQEIVVSEAGSGVDAESAALLRARTQVKARLMRVSEVGGAARREIAAAHVGFVDDPLLNEVAQEFIAAGKSAGYAWRAATRRSMALLQGLADERLRERADDLLDVESHVLHALAGEARPLNLPLPARAVLLANDLLPSELVALDRERLSAICLASGGATSHVAILAAAMDVPMLVGIGAGLRAVAEGTTLIVDADAGVLEVAPTQEASARAERRASAQRVQRAAERSAAQRECRSLDGTRIEVYANLGSVADASAAVANGAEGCGLLRTEFLFIDRDTAPSEAEQRDTYQAIAAALAGRPMVLRLMDVGGDKPLAYLPLPPEENPALGLRGIRTALWRKDLLQTQLRAALQVEPVALLRLLLPMITDVEEVRTVRALVDQLRAQLGGREAVQIGAMIETPAAALTAALIAREADFLSIGSNDLTQYALAMDRGHAELAARMDALHPAVLQLIAATAAAGSAAGKVVAVCGGVAADPMAVPLLLGLGVTELSVVPAAVPAVKKLVSSLDLAPCRLLAERCLGLESAAAVRSLVAQSLPTLGDSR